MGFNLVVCSLTEALAYVLEVDTAASAAASTAAT
jgi:hypothetical protein